MTKKGPPPSAWSRLRDLAASRLGRGLLLTIGASVGFLGIGFVVREARAQSYRIEAYRLGPGDLTFTGIDPVFGSEAGESLHGGRWIRFDVSVFDPLAEAEIRRAVARHPMVRGVRSVTIRYPRSVSVAVVLREPVARFRLRGPDGREHDVPVSGDARLLAPGPYRSYLRQLHAPLPLVVGVESTPPRGAGQAWEDLAEQVAEGLSAAKAARRLHRESRGYFHVERIDVSRFPAPLGRREEGEVRFHLDDGTVVEWGRTDRDREGRAFEDRYETKRWRLEQLWSSRRGRIDVRFPLRGEEQPLGLGR